MVPRMTPFSLPFQMFWIKNKLMPFGGEICARLDERRWARRTGSDMSTVIW